MVPLVISFTPSYFVPAATMLSSLLKSSPLGCFHVICLVTEDIPERMKEKLERLGAGRLELEYINLGGRLKDVYTDPRYSEAASFRLLLPDLLLDYGAVVYIDCDIIVRQDIAILYKDVDITGKYLAAVYEAPIEGQAARWEALGCDPGAYFNSGFLIMNLALMRQDVLVGKFLEASKVDWLEFPDQDVLNQVCKGRVLPLEPVYNGIRTFFLPHYKADFLKCYTEEMWERIQTEGTIHYTGGKPWDIFTVQFATWWRTYDALPEEIKSEWKPAAKIRLIWSIYKTGAGRAAVDSLRALYRKIKH